MRKVYKLMHDYSQLGDMDFDARFELFDGHDRIGYEMLGTGLFKIPDIIYCRANFRIIPDKSDFPITDLSFPILSKRVLSQMLSIQIFKYRQIKILMIDDTYPNSYLDDKGELISDVRREEYCGIQLLETTDVFDFEKSEYRPMRSNPSMPGVIKKLVMKEPKGGFPPIFRIKENMSLIFISHEAKIAIEAVNGHGFLFEDVNTN